MDSLTARIDGLLAEQKQIIVAVDGNCTAGKTTLAAALAERYDCNVFHMDDFFLRPEQRTAKRLMEIGGNVDYERFKSEVLDPLKGGGSFCYRPYDCHELCLTKPVEVSPKRLSIIEGTYSLHPAFGDYADLKIFLRISPELQRERILRRPSFLHKRFFSEWIPMEQRYFDGFSITERCDQIIDASDLTLSTKG